MRVYLCVLFVSFDSHPGTTDSPCRLSLTTLLSAALAPASVSIDSTLAVPKVEDTLLVRSAKDVMAGTIAGVGITLVGHPFGQCRTPQSTPEWDAREGCDAKCDPTLTLHHLLSLSLSQTL
jgi:hypothetical protein